MEAVVWSEHFSKNIITLAKKHVSKVWPPLHEAIFCEEFDGDVRIGRNGWFSKVSEIDQVVLVGKELEIKLRNL